MWEWMECDRYFPSMPFVVLTVDQFVGHSGGPLGRQKLATFIEKLAYCFWFFRRNQSRHYINELVWETVQVWAFALTEKLVFDKTYEKIVAAGPHFGTHGCAISLFLILAA